MAGCSRVDGGDNLCGRLKTTKEGRDVYPVDRGSEMVREDPTRVESPDEASSMRGGSHGRAVVAAHDGSEKSRRSP